jgi:type IV secretory pathway TrbL component
MQKPVTLIRSSTSALAALAILAIALKYPGLINIKLPGAEILIDGRSIQAPAIEAKFLERK